MRISRTGRMSSSLTRFTSRSQLDFHLQLSAPMSIYLWMEASSKGPTQCTMSSSAVATKLSTWTTPGSMAQSGGGKLQQHPTGLSLRSGTVAIHHLRYQEIAQQCRQYFSSLL